MELGREYYDVLNVPRSASMDEIRAAFRRLAARFHPDRNPGDAEAVKRFQEISRAYAVLADFHKAARAAGRRFRVTVPKARPARPTSRKGRSIRVRLVLDPEEARRGCTRPVTILRTEVCARCAGVGAAPIEPEEPCFVCGGSGRIRFEAGRLKTRRDCFRCKGTGRMVQDPCPECGGRARIQARRVVEVRVPPEFDGTPLAPLVGEGHASAGAGVAGDVRVCVKIATNQW